ncbi:MAG TPA: zinc-ribbon domain-containing protein [Candidatus Methanoperedens sp.]
MKCSNCGFENPENAKFCGKCGRLIGPETTGPVQTVQKQTQVKNPGIAALLSFLISGAGQIYNGQLAKGIAAFITMTIGFIIAISTPSVMDPAMLLLILFMWIVILIVWIYWVYDAYNTAQKINRGEIKVDTISLTQ